MARELPIFGQDSTIRVTWGFIIQIILTVAGMAAGYMAIRSDLSAVIRQTEYNQVEVEKQRVILTNQQIQIGIMSQQLLDFRNTYEKDFEKYIREPKR